VTSPEIHVHVHLPELTTLVNSITRMETAMATASEQLAALKTQIADTTADVLAKIEQLGTQMDTLTPEAQATLDAITAGVQSLDDAVGDADGSDVPV
jgi:phage shock protein A